MPQILSGIHHITAIAGPAQQNVDFYAGFLGLRLVKQTVNFDDTGTYHLYYGDEVGSPGSILTFFPWPDAYQGRAGSGMAVTTAYSIPSGAIGFWMGRFADEGWPFDAPVTRYGESVLGFADPDGLRLELIADPSSSLEQGNTQVWSRVVAPEYAIQRFHSTTLLLDDPEPTARLLVDVFGYEALGEESTRLRFRLPTGIANIIDIIRPETATRGRGGKGTVHHIAFRARDEVEQKDWSDILLTHGLNVTPSVDRQYFRSIYFREPGGVLFEIATDSPGFATDEAPEALGSSLKLPPWIEPKRKRIEEHLPTLRVPTGTIHLNPTRS